MSPEYQTLSKYDNLYRRDTFWVTHGILLPLFTIHTEDSWCSVVGIVIGLRSGRSEVWIPVHQNAFLFSKTPKPKLVFTQPHMRRVPALLSVDESSLWVRMNTRLHLVSRLRMSGVLSPLPLYSLIGSVRTRLLLLAPSMWICENILSHCAPTE